MRKNYKAPNLTVSYDPTLCIHAARCVAGLPDVFDPKARPWIRPERAGAAAIADVVRRCPTGSLLYETSGAIAPEKPEETVTVTMAKDGPLYVRGAAHVLDGGGDAFETGPRFALCRCGGSGNKPFCDGTHRTMGFQG